jgi:post-segregation antitoxin (ccd killing protein)
VSTQNVTISLPGELITQAKHLAVDEGVSLSRFVAKALEREVRTAADRRAALERLLKALETGFDLGTGGKITWDRDSLHDREALRER